MGVVRTIVCYKPKKNYLASSHSRAPLCVFALIKKNAFNNIILKRCEKKHRTVMSLFQDQNDENQVRFFCLSKSFSKKGDFIWQCFVWDPSLADFRQFPSFKSFFRPFCGQNLGKNGYFLRKLWPFQSFGPFPTQNMIKGE